MVVLVTSEERLTRSLDGSIWGASSYAFWTRYLDVFEEMRLLARVVDGVPTAAQSRVEGPRVSVTALPNYTGPAGYLRRRSFIRRAVAQSFERGNAVIMRV